MNLNQVINGLIPFKKLTEKSLNLQSDIYESLEIVKPFTTLAGDRLNVFIAELAENNSLNETEKQDLNICGLLRVLI